MPTLKKTDIAAISSCNLFRNTDDALVEELLTGGEYTVVTVKKGEDIFSPENYRRCLAVILKGSAEVSKQTEKGKLLMSTLTAGNVFGMSCLFYDGESFPTTVRAKDDVRLILITNQQLTSLFSRYPAVLENYLGILSKKIHFLNEKIESISSPDATAALRQYLENTAERLGADTFSLPIPMSKLASTLGLGRTSVYRALDELAEQGFLRKEGKVITIIERTEKK